MADETQGNQQGEQGEPNGAQETTDWEAKYNELKKHSREWERKAKANKDAADELAALKESQMSEAEKLQQQLADATARADALQAEKDRRQWISEVSEETGVPADLLEMVSAGDRDELASKADVLKEKYAANKQPTVPVVIGDGKHADVAKAGASAKDDFAKFMKTAFR